MAFSLAHLANIDTLKSIKETRLRSLLESSGDFSIPVSEDGKIDFKQLFEILLEPEKLPTDLANALFYIDALATRQGADELQDQVLAIDDLNIPCVGQDVSPADYVVRVWKKRPDLVKRVLAESSVENIQSMESYYGKKAKGITKISTSKRDKIAAAMDLWFTTMRRGTGTEISSFVKHGAIWLVVRRGNAFKREAMIDQDTKASTASFGYPETHDILIYDPKYNELRIHADSVPVKKEYRRVLGAELFKDGTYFTLGQKYTLEPLRLGKAKALKPVKGLESVRLTRIEYPLQNEQNEVVIHKGDDLLASFDERDTSFDNATSISWDAIPSLSAASMRLKFGDVDGIAIGERTLTIIPPNRAQFKRDAATPIIENFLARNEYNVRRPETEDADEDS